MAQIKPGINADGFRVAVKDYTEPTVIEELGANSYDADATTFLVLLDSKNFRLFAIDDGVGFEESAFSGLATLGYGDKKEIPYSKRNRHYLGSYGFGIKSTLNISDRVEIISLNNSSRHQALIEWGRLEELLRDPEKTFISETKSTKKGRSGTLIAISLKRPTDKTHLEKFYTALSNLPTDGGNFRCYVGMYDDVADSVPRDKDQWIRRHSKLVEAWCSAGKIRAVDTTNLADLAQAHVEEKVDKIDTSVKAKFYFTGFDGDKIKPLKKGLRGIYVRIHGRLLKQSFTDRLYTAPISKWVKFESGLRVELEIDWLRDQITLSREGIRFENEKLQSDFKQILTRMVSGFIQPHLKKIEGNKKKLIDKRSAQRQELCKKRVRGDKDAIIPGLESGFVYKPESDAELALILSHPKTMSKVLKNHILVDYNDQAPFDCVLYDETRKEYINCEMEPRLESFLQHNDASDVHLIIVWSKAGWRIGAQKKGKSGYLKLHASAGGRKGEYTLLELAQERSTKPRREYKVIVLEEILIG